MLKIISRDTEDTKRIGEVLSSYLFPGAIICLSGNLGAGKTAFVQGIGRGIGITEPITSPTYTIINEYYSARIPLYHFDVYRLGDSDEMLELGCDEYFFGKGITVVEWADNVRDIIPAQRFWINILYREDLRERDIIIEAQGEIYKRILEEMGANEDISS